MFGFNGAVALFLATAVWGLLRMRTWGLLLGGLTSVILLGVAPFYGAVNAVTLSLAALPALVFWIVPVLFGRRAPTRLRVADSTQIRVDAAYSEEVALLDVVDDAGAGDTDQRRAALR
jgi:hypothetical protein